MLIADGNSPYPANSTPRYRFMLRADTDPGISSNFSFSFLLFIWMRGRGGTPSYCLSGGSLGDKIGRSMLISRPLLQMGQVRYSWLERSQWQMQTQQKRWPQGVTTGLRAVSMQMWHWYFSSSIQLIDYMRDQGFSTLIDYMRNRRPRVYYCMQRLRDCLQSVLALISREPQQPHQLISKRSSILESSTCEMSSPLGHEESFSTVFMGEQGAMTFIPPNISEETDEAGTKRNLTIEKCKEGRYYILNGLQNAYIDECEELFILVGPCHSTIFIRHCRNLKIRALSQQLRIENSENILIEGIVGVRPVLEGSHHIKFSELSMCIYDDLLWQMEQAKLSIFHNQIFDCYDFTPKKPPNFLNETPHADIDPDWPRLLQEGRLNEDRRNVCLPRRLPIKRSMVSKLYTLKYLESNPEVRVACCNMDEKQVLAALGGEGAHGKIEVIEKLDRQKCRRIGKREGDTFLLVRGEGDIERVEWVNDAKLMRSMICDE